MQEKQTLKNKKSRILYLDVARGLAILFMFAQHSVFVHELSAGNGESLLANIFLLLGTAPAAPVFLVIMGVFLMKSKAGLKKNILRGVKIILLGYLLNLFRFTLPMLITGENNYLYFAGETAWDMLFTVSLLQLAGLSFILGALLKPILKNKMVAPLIILFILIISPLLCGKFGDNILTSFFWGHEKNVSFPFFPWFIYTLLGMYLSKFLLAIDSLKQNLKKLSIIGIIIFIFGIFLYNFFPNTECYSRGIPNHFTFIGFILIWLPVCYWIVKNLKSSNIFIQLLAFWSINVTAIYFIQWLFFGWSIIIFDANQQSATMAALIGLVILVTSTLIVKNKKIQKLFARI